MEEEKEIVKATERKLNLIDKIRLRLFGSVYIGHRTLPGWKDSQPFYLFMCPTHGLKESYPSGYNKILQCDECLEDKDN